MYKRKYFKALVINIFSTLLLGSCYSQVKLLKDSLYSRHLQQHIELEILNAPLPKDKHLVNLLLLNDGQDIGQLRILKMMDSLNKKNLLKPLIVVGINAADRMLEYGVSGHTDYENNGTSAGKYAAFVDDELIAFIKKWAAIQAFKSITIAGCSLGGLSAFDIAWDHADKIDKVGVFSGSFWYRDKDSKDSTYSDENDWLIINKVKFSRKRPRLKYWFYAGDKEETADRDNDGIIDVVDDTKDLVNLIIQKKVCPPADIIFTESKEGKHDYETWSSVLPQFLIWADGK